MILMLRYLDVTIPDGVKEGDLITVYRGEALVGDGQLQERTQDGVALQLDRKASDNFSDLGRRGLPYQFVVRERESTNDNQ